LIKPVYGLLSDFVPLFGRRRQSYLWVTSALAAAAGVALGGGVEHTYWWLAGLFTVMALGLAFTDVLVDALMVASGKPRGLTGAFQSVQWGAIQVASVLVGEIGGYLAERRALSASFILAASFPLLCFAMTLGFVREAPGRADLAAFRETMGAIRSAIAERELRTGAGFIFFCTFTPAFGPRRTFSQTELLEFRDPFVRH